MKKLPIILSSLALAGMANPASAIELTEADYLQPGETVNTVQGGIWVTQVYPYTAEVTIDISHFISTEGRQLSKIYLASYDYKAGISVAEADERAKQLGEISFEAWMGKMLDKTVTSQALSSTVRIDYFDLTKDNPTDIIYYAFKLENPNDPEVEVEWIRGKVDYRECVHSEPFATKKASICQLLQNGTTGKYYYVPKNYSPTSDPVLSWPAEMRMLLEEQWETIGEDVKALEQKHDDYQEIPAYLIVRETQAVNEFEELVGKLELAEDYTGQITEMWARLEALKTPKEKPVEPEPEEPTTPEEPEPEEPEESEGPEGPEEPEEPVTPVEPGPEEPDGSEEPEQPVNLGELETSGSPEGTEGTDEAVEVKEPERPTVSVGSADIAEDKNEPENTQERPLGGAQSDEKSETQSDGSTNVSGLVAASTGLTGQNYSVVAGPSEGGEGENEDDDEDTDEEEVELPNLGGEEIEGAKDDRSWWWLWVVLVLMAGGFTVWRVRRSSLKRGKNSL